MPEHRDSLSGDGYGVTSDVGDEALTECVWRINPVEERVLEQLVPVIFRRLGMQPEDWEYEVDVPEHEGYRISMAGGGANTELILTPVIEVGGMRREGEPVEFQIFQNGVFRKDQPSIGLFDWLRANPWASISIG